MANRRHEDAGSCASTWAQLPASARRTRCSARRTAGWSAAPTWSPRSSRRTAARRPPSCSTGIESSRRATSSTAAAGSPNSTSTLCCSASPQVVLVDELAHTNTPGSRNPKRWQDVEELLDAGITVISTVNVQHLESLNDVVTQITGIEQQEKVPDEVVRAADQIELVDITPEALRRRLSHGNVYAAGAHRRRAVQLLPARQPDRAARTGAAVAGRPGRRRAGQVPRRQQHHRHLGGPRTGRGRGHRRAGVGDPGAPGLPDRVEVQRRADGRARGARRRAGRCVRARRWARCASSPTSLGATLHTVVGDDVPAALLDFAREMNATQLVLGTSRRSRWARIFDEGIGAAVVQQSGQDRRAHGHPRGGQRGASLVARCTAAAPPRCPGWPRSWCRRPSARSSCWLLDPFLGIGGESALFFIGVLVVALLGGVAPAALSALLSGLLLNYFLVEPRYTLHHRRTRQRHHRRGAAAGRRRGRGAGRRRGQPGPGGPDGVAGSRTAGAVRRFGAARRRPGHAAGAGPRDVLRSARSACCGAATATRTIVACVGAGPVRRRRHRRHRHRGRRRRILDADGRPQAGRPRPPGADRGRQTGGRAGQAARTDRGGRQGRGDRPGRRAAPLTAVGGQPRPAHAPGRRQGRGVQPAQRRCRLLRRGHRRTAGHRRGVHRPADRAGRQPAGLVAAGGRRGPPELRRVYLEETVQRALLGVSKGATGFGRQGWTGSRSRSATPS